jgi:hypothetical protein
MQRFPLSLRKVENLLFERVIDVCCENRAQVVESLATVAKIDIIPTRLACCSDIEINCAANFNFDP